MTINREKTLELFRIGSGSGREQGTIKFIENWLSENRISYHKDANGNIWNFSHINRPFVSAHMDTVQKEEDEKVAKFIDIYDDVIRGYGVIGGDDKCGIIICLELIKKYKDINFSFSIEEEIGGSRGASVIASRNSAALKQKVTYGLIFDRRGNSDIICNLNSYGSKDFEKELCEIGKEFDYKPVRGSVSDADKFKTYVSCANLSSGYYNPHSSTEYVIISDLEKALNYGDKIISTLNERFDPCPITTSYYGGGGYNGWDNYDEYGFGYGRSFRKKNNINNKTNKETALVKVDEEEIEDEDGFTLFTNCDLCNKYTKTVMLVDSNLCLCEKCMGHLLDDIKTLIF